MPISASEMVADVPEAVAFAEAVIAQVNALPPAKDRKLSDVLKLAASILNAACPLADKLAAQAKD